MEFIIAAIEEFVNKLPPLLQLMLGAAVFVAGIKALIIAIDFFEKKRGEK